MQAAVAQVPAGTAGTWLTVKDVIGRKLYVDYQNYKLGSADPDIEKRSGLVRKRGTLTDDDVDTLNGYLVALEGSKTDEEKLERLQAGLGKLEEVFISVFRCHPTNQTTVRNGTAGVTAKSAKSNSCHIRFCKTV